MLAADPLHSLADGSITVVFWWTVVWPLGVFACIALAVLAPDRRRAAESIALALAVPPALLLAAATAIARPDPAPALVVALALTLAAIVLLAATLYAGRGRDEPPRLHFMLAFAVAGLASVCASLACLTVAALTRAA